jgi:hypothetical protein
MKGWPISNRTRVPRVIGIMNSLNVSYSERSIASAIISISAGKATLSGDRDGLKVCSSISR